MGERSAIEWTESTWNPLRGCARVSDGCRRCYAEGIAHRFSGAGQAYEGLTRLVNGHPTWTGEVRLVPELLLEPIRWQTPRRIFVNSMSDLFHESVPFEYIAKVFAVMACTRRHTYQVLTKRPERMLAFFKWLDRNTVRGWPAAVSPGDVYPEWKPWREGGRGGGYDCCGPSWPLDNVWLGTSCEDQTTFDARIPHLLKVPAVVRWISFEPLLGAINAEAAFSIYDVHGEPSSPRCDADGSPAIKWVVVGGESGRGARPMHPGWVRTLRAQTLEAGAAFFFKQWGEWKPVDDAPGIMRSIAPGDQSFQRVGKKAAGRLLDGQLHDEYPDA